ncbi:pentatricopeptide repeat-containing protein At1g74600, chloroplastic [Henckelia pumila]|uniref:pentatricopeptide repeat-containing protein At1g74600, chloroplastic n=1 Tax=Henckelia pumila TaxID=405737 RepID=UPI003C6DD16D
MNGIKSPSLSHKSSLKLARKLLCSTASPDNRLIEATTNYIKVDPVDLLANPTNFRRLTLTEAKTTHAVFLKTCVLYSNIYVANNLIDSYSECRRVNYALDLFEELSEPNVVTWNLMISGFNKNSCYDDSWWAFCQMHVFGVEFDEFTYSSIFAACGALESVVCGEQVYAHVIKNGFFFNDYVRTGAIDLFTRSCRVKDALRVLDDVDSENVVCWNAVLSGAVKNEDNRLALEIFRQICWHASITPNSFTFASVLTGSAALKELPFGKSIHGWTIKCGVGTDVFVGTAIVDLYAKCGAICDAIKQFNLMPMRNVISWTAIISGFVGNGDSASAVWVLDEMRKKGEDINSYTISSVLSACAYPDMFKEAKQIHCWILKIGFYSNAVVKASLISMYSKLGAIDLSEIAFADTDNLKMVGIWANMISALVRNQSYEKAILLFQRMVKEGVTTDKFSASSILSIIDDLSFGRQLHGYVHKTGLQFDLSVGGSILTMYSKCGNLEESLKAFEQLERRDIVSWTSMLAGFAEHGSADNAFRLFREMQFEEYIPDVMILKEILTACSDLRSMKLGKEIHGFSLRRRFQDQIILGGALVNMYSKCGDLNAARIVFDRIPFKDQVSWSSLISGFAQRGHIEEALQLFQDMLLSELSIDTFTFSSILWALANLNRPVIGTQVHVHAIKTGVESEASVGSALVLMYSKCGGIHDSITVFQQIKNPDLFSFTTMIASYAQHGKGLEALKVYELMKKSGIAPDEVAFVGILSACSRSGLVEEAYFHLNSMIKDYGLEPGNKHYTCMVDLLGRAGRLAEAERFIANMPMEPDSLVWETLLAACKIHGNHDLSRLAAQKILELQPSDAGAYISVANILADAGRWEHVLKIRGSMKETGIKKEPGWSSV